FPDFSGQTLQDGRYQVISILGVGAYGKVFKALDTSATNEHFVAIKCVEQPEPGSREDVYQTREFILHKKVSDHPNIITFHGHFREHGFVFVVLDICDAGDLYNALVKKDFFLNKDDLVKSVMIQLIDALQHCHENSVFHRDLKPENVLLDDDGHLYLADFGLCTDNAISEEFGCGTSLYMSPECFGVDTKKKSFETASSDLWALGIILVNIITGLNPWRRAIMADRWFNAF
ncbi:kinase-like domain-containing protein, partial [Mycena floridula]